MILFIKYKWKKKIIIGGFNVQVWYLEKEI